MNTDTKSLTTVLTPRQSTFIRAYTDPVSSSFGNCYQSAVAAGYSDTTARNLTHLNPEWLSENIGRMTAIKPDEIMTVLTDIIYNSAEPTVVRLRAIEMTMRAYNMLAQHREQEQKSLTLNIDLSGNSPSTATV